MTAYYLGVDVGSTKTHALVADQDGRARGFGVGGPGNHETVGYNGLQQALKAATDQALATASLAASQIDGAGFGISGYDWLPERAPTLAAVASLGIKAPCETVNDTLLGLLAGAEQGWGIAIVSGSGCNCRGLDREGREGRVTGNGYEWGEGAGASELMVKARQAVAYEWCQRRPATLLTSAFLKHAGSKNLDEMIEGLVLGTKHLGSEAAPLVFQAAKAGDQAASEIIRWAGEELGEMAKCVIRQLHFEELEFEVVLVGSMFEGGELLIGPMRQAILGSAPGARLVRLKAPPVTGAVLLGMRAAGIVPSGEVGRNLGKFKPRN